MGDAWARGRAPAPTQPDGDVSALAAAWLGTLNDSMKGFARHPATDVRGGVLATLMTTSVREMAAICQRWPRCKGFTSDGTLRTDVAPTAPRAGGCGGRSAYELIRGYDLCTADTCNDFAPPDKQVNRFPQGRSLRQIRPASIEQLEEACEATPRCAGFSVASWGNATELGGWLKGGTIRTAADASQLNSTDPSPYGPYGHFVSGELTARPDANLYRRVGGAATAACDLYVKA